MYVTGYVCKECWGIFPTTCIFIYLLQKISRSISDTLIFALKKNATMANFAESMLLCFKLNESVGNENYLYTVLCHTKVHQSSERLIFVKLKFYIDISFILIIFNIQLLFFIVMIFHGDFNNVVFTGSETLVHLLNY